MPGVNRAPGESSDAKVTGRESLSILRFAQHAPDLHPASPRNPLPCPKEADERDTRRRT